MNLYQLNSDFQYVMDQLETAIENGDEVTMTELTDVLSDIGLALDDKIENCALYVKSIEAEAEAIKAEEKRLSIRRKALENRAENMRKYIAQFGHAVKTPRVVVSVRDLADRVVIDKTAEVPHEWCEMVVTYKPITDLIENKIKAGKCDIAGITLETNRKSVTIK